MPWPRALIAAWLVASVTPGDLVRRRVISGISQRVSQNGSWDPCSRFHDGLPPILS